MTITMFWGRECPHCHVMMPLVDKLIREGARVEKKEVWHNEKNANVMRANMKVILKYCDDLGVPCWLNAKKDRAVCGEMPLSKLKAWIKKNS